MAATRYFDRQTSPAVRTITQSGAQPGPQGGEGWQLLEQVAGARLPTSGGIMLFVTGIVSNATLFGDPAAAITGHLQLCLGNDNANLKSSVHQWGFPVTGRDELTPDGGRRFCFLVVIDSALGITDPTWSSAWPSGADLSIYGRLYWNQDQPLYGISWEVSDLDITWSYLDDIPAEEKHGWIEPQFQAPPGNSSISDPTAFGGVDETWLTFAAIYTLPAQDTATQFQVTGAGGERALFGLALWPGPASTSTRQSSDGYHQSRRMLTATTTQLLLSTSSASGTGQTRVLRLVLFHIKLDALAPLLQRSDDNVADFTESIGSATASARALALEVSTGTVTFEPFIFASMTVRQATVNAPRAHALRLTDTDGETYAQPIRYQFGGPTTEQMHLMQSSNGIGFGDPAFRYRLQCVKPGQAGTLHDPVVYSSWVIFHPVRDPDGQAPTVPGVGDPVPIVPGAEGPPGSSAQALPIQPNGSFEETVDDTREMFQGHTAYVRTWGTWLEPRRTFQLEWSPVSAADRDAVATVIKPGIVFAMTPPGEAAISVTAIERRTVSGLGAGTWRVSVRVVELVYTA